MRLSSPYLGIARGLVAIIVQGGGVAAPPNKTEMVVLVLSAPDSDAWRSRLLAIPHRHRGSRWEDW